MTVRPRGYRVSDLAHYALSLFSARTGAVQEKTVESAIWNYVGTDYLKAMSEVVIEDGDVTWWITELPGGRWAAWDDSEPMSPDRVEYFETRDEAVAFHRDSHEDIVR